MVAAAKDTAEATVVAVSARSVTVRLEAKSVCARCAEGRGCGALALTGTPSQRVIEIANPRGLDLHIGERVNLVLESHRLLHAAWLAYGLPTLAICCAALAANWFWPATASDGVAALAAAGGLVFAGWFARRRLGRAGCLGRFVPELRREDNPPPFRHKRA